MRHFGLSLERVVHAEMMEALFFVEDDKCHTLYTVPIFNS